MKKCKLLLFDLDGTLLRSDKTISQKTLNILQECREKGILIGVSTSRGEQNALCFIDELQPDVLIASGGALVKYNGEYIYNAEFSGEETKRMIATAYAFRMDTGINSPKRPQLKKGLLWKSVPYAKLKQKKL